MHHIFEVDEILRLIASSITYESPKDAISFARCCKPFSSPTLDTLWGQCQRDFTRLLQTLPPSVWVIEDETFNFLREPSEEEWRRLSIYAGRMRYFMGLIQAPSEAALKLLNARFSGGCMLPNLRDIRWLNASTEHLELTLPLIVSSALTDFRLGFDTHGPSDASQVVPALEALAPAYDSLVAVRICHSTIHDPRIIRAASDLLLKCNPDRLRDFYVISVLFAEAFVHASQLPNLESFVIRTDTTDLQVSLPAPAFPSLEWLEIDAVNTRSPLIQTISHVQSRAFFRLQLEFPAATSGTFLPTTLAALRPRGLHETLTVLAIHPKGDFDLDGTTVRPILFLNQLTDLEITLICADRCAYKLSDENLDELVRAMPKLKQLSLGPFPCTRLVDNTIKSLTSAAKHCKHLEHLAIHINVVAVVTGVFQGGDRDQNRAPDDSLSVFAGCPLRSIILGRCFIPNEEQGAVIFALTLLRLFPHLRSFAVAQLNRDEDPLWDIVEGVITTHRRIRINIADAAAGMEAD